MSASRRIFARPRTGATVLHTFIDALSWDEAVGRVLAWAGAGASCYVCICNSHAVATALWDSGLAAAINKADMATPDGWPVAWALRRMGYAGQRRIAGPDLMERLCERLAGTGTPVFLYGGTPDVLGRLRHRLERSFPGLVIAGMHSPPFRRLTAGEDRDIVERINASGARVVFVGLGCPKQELWMREHQGRIAAVMIGVGAAFDFHAGSVRRAPGWMQHSGLEWLHRLASEPRRLWRRYLVTNTVFAVGIVRQFLQPRGAAQGNPGGARVRPQLMTLNESKGTIHR